jgi:hypothetical protein
VNGVKKPYRTVEILQPDKDLATITQVTAVKGEDIKIAKIDLSGGPVPPYTEESKPVAPKPQKIITLKREAMPKRHEDVIDFARKFEEVHGDPFEYFRDVLIVEVDPEEHPDLFYLDKNGVPHVRTDI